MTITRVGLGIILFTVVLIFLMINVQNLSAGSIIIVPNPVTQGESFQVSGGGFPVGQPFFVGVYADPSGSCSPFPPLFEVTGIVGAEGNIGPFTFSSGGLSVGRHCVQIDVPGIFLGGIFLRVLPGVHSTNSWIYTDSHHADGPRKDRD